MNAKSIQTHHTLCSLVFDMNRWNASFTIHAFARCIAEFTHGKECYAKYMYMPTHRHELDEMESTPCVFYGKALCSVLQHLLTMFTTSNCLSETHDTIFWRLVVKIQRNGKAKVFFRLAFFSGILPN